MPVFGSQISFGNINNVLLFLANYTLQTYIILFKKNIRFRVFHAPLSKRCASTGWISLFQMLAPSHWSFSENWGDPILTEGSQNWEEPVPTKGKELWRACLAERKELWRTCSQVTHGAVESLLRGKKEAG